MYHPFMHQYDSGFGWVGSVFWFTLLLVLIVGLLRIARHHGYDRHWHDRAVDPLDIAKERYARGDISKEQFEQIKEDLK